MPKRKYDNKYPSVTTVLGILRKIGLEQWFINNSKEYIQHKSSMGKKIGTEIHEAIEQYITKGTTEFKTKYPDEVGTALKSFIKFKQENPDIKLELSEQALTSEIYKYNGTIDCIAGNILVDWKTAESKEEDKPKIYPEMKYQVSAYVHLWNEKNKKQVDTAVIVVIAKDKVAYNTYTMSGQEINECFYQVFLPALRILNYQKRK